MINVHKKNSAILKPLSGLVLGHTTFLVQHCYAVCRSRQIVFHVVLLQSAECLSKVKLNLKKQVCCF